MNGTLAEFADILVIPAQHLRMHIPHGGPIWPDFATQHAVRHCRDGKPVDSEPPAPTGPVARLDGQAIWGGCIDAHFGHFVAESVSRVMLAHSIRPDLPFLFTLDPVLQGRVPDWAMAVLAWCGLQPAQIMAITTPVRVARLWVGPQAETLPQIAPDAAYLDLLDARMATLPAMVQDCVYVTRTGLAVQGFGAIAGEGYLTGLLAQLGMAVLDPATTDIPAQLATYAGARHLIFAEGSALHGRQLLGRLPQRVSVLCRRPGRTMARAMLRPRVRRLDYHNVTAASLVPQWKNRQPRPDPALAFFDLPGLFAALDACDIDLSTHWSDSAYRADVRNDLAGWLMHRPPTPALRESYAGILAGLGLALPAIQAISQGPDRPHHAI